MSSIILGKQNNTSTISVDANNKRVSFFERHLDYSLGFGQFYIESIWIQFYDNQTGNVKALLYDYAGSDQPGNLVWTSSEVTNPSGLTEFVVNQSFPLEDYYVGFICDSNINCRGFYYRVAGQYPSTNADTYSDGPSDPFGTGTIDTYVSFTAYATGYLTGNFTELNIASATSVNRQPQSLIVPKTMSQVVLAPPESLLVPKVVSYAVLEELVKRNQATSIIIA